jgi:hypothetical protein
MIFHRDGACRLGAHSAAQPPRLFSLSLMQAGTPAVPAYFFLIFTARSMMSAFFRIFKRRSLSSVGLSARNLFTILSASSLRWPPMKAPSQPFTKNILRLRLWFGSSFRARSRYGSVRSECRIEFHGRTTPICPKWDSSVSLLDSETMLLGGRNGQKVAAPGHLGRLGTLRDRRGHAGQWDTAGQTGQRDNRTPRDTGHPDRCPVLMQLKEKRRSQMAPPGLPDRVTPTW